MAFSCSKFVVELHLPKHVFAESSSLSPSRRVMPQKPVQTSLSLAEIGRWSQLSSCRIKLCPPGGSEGKIGGGRAGALHDE